MEQVEAFKFLFLQTLDYDLDLQPLAFTVDDYENPKGIVEEIIKTGIEIEIPKANQRRKTREGCIDELAIQGESMVSFGYSQKAKDIVTEHTRLVKEKIDVKHVY